MATHWPEIASVDYAFKLIVSLGLFLPAYGVLLKVLQDKILLNDITTDDDIIIHASK
jgi:uncharacterized PurR-regulated membrane protein YhhQ (DUF165 family)